MYTYSTSSTSGDVGVSSGSLGASRLTMSEEGEDPLTKTKDTATSDGGVQLLFHLFEVRTSSSCFAAICISTALVLVLRDLPSSKDPLARSATGAHILFARPSQLRLSFAPGPSILRGRWWATVLSLAGDRAND